MSSVSAGAGSSATSPSPDPGLRPLIGYVRSLRARPARGKTHVGTPDRGLVRNGYEAFGRGDMDVVLELLRDTEWVEAEGAPHGGVYNGSEAILNGVFGRLMQQLQDFKATPHEILAVDGDRVLAIGNYTGKGLGGALNARFAQLWTVRDGRATHCEQFADTALLRQAVSE